MSIIDELMTEILKNEYPSNEQQWYGKVKEIKIRPEWFYKLLADPEVIGYHEVHQDGSHMFRGIPLNRTTAVEKWVIEKEQEA